MPREIEMFNNIRAIYTVSTSTLYSPKDIQIKVEIVVKDMQITVVVKIGFN